MFHDVLVDQNPHWVEKLDDCGIRRSHLDKLIEYLELPQVVAVTGVRRCGKSMLLKQAMHHLITNQKVAVENILFLNLEQPFLLKFSDDVQNLELIFQEYLTLKNPQGKIYVLLDEIQFFKDWPVFIKANYENKQVKFIITGSNSKLLSSDMVTMLSGRAMALELYPLSLQEIVNGKNIKSDSKSAIVSSRNEIKHCLLRSLEQGCFPEILSISKQSLYYDVLNSYVKTILLQDIAPRLNIRKPKQLEELFIYLASNISSIASYNTLSKQFSLSDKSVKEYIQAFEDAYLIFELNKFSFSSKPHNKTLKKIYAIDTGVANACGFRFSSNNGKLLENMIFIDCKSRGLDIFYYKTKQDFEIDFIIKEHNNIAPIQVVYNINDQKTFNREVRALQAAMDELNIEVGYLITMDPILDFELQDPRIISIQAYEWLLR